MKGQELRTHSACCTLHLTHEHTLVFNVGCCSLCLSQKSRRAVCTDKETYSSVIPYYLAIPMHEHLGEGGRIGSARLSVGIPTRFLPAQYKSQLPCVAG